MCTLVTYMFTQVKYLFTQVEHMFKYVKLTLKPIISNNTHLTKKTRPPRVRTKLSVGLSCIMIQNQTESETNTADFVVNRIVFNEH